MIQVAVFVIDFDMASLSPLVQGRAGLGPIHLKGGKVDQCSGGIAQQGLRPDDGKAPAN
jgi:hypothetical protein